MIGGRTQKKSGTMEGVDQPAIIPDPFLNRF